MPNKEYMKVTTTFFIELDPENYHDEDDENDPKVPWTAQEMVAFENSQYESGDLDLPDLLEGGTNLRVIMKVATETELKNEFII